MSSNEKAESSSAYSSHGWKSTGKILEAVPDTQRKEIEKLCYNWLFYLCGNYGKIRVYYVWQGQPQEYNMKSAKREECAPWIMVGAGVSAHGKTSLVIIDKKV